MNLPCGCKDPSRFFKTERERSIFELLASGYSITHIATALVWSERTVKYAVAAVVERHGLRTRTHAVAEAIRRGVIK